MHNPIALKSITIASGLATGVFILFTADQLGPFAPLIVAIGFYLIIYFAIQAVLLGIGGAWCAFRNRNRGDSHA